MRWSAWRRCTRSTSPISESPNLFFEEFAMRRVLLACAVSVSLAGPARAQDKRATLMLETLERVDRRFDQMTVQQQQAALHMAAIGQEVKALRTEMSRFQTHL